MMSECDSPSDNLQIKTSCNDYTCPDINKGEFGIAWKRVPSCNLMYFGTGTYDNGGLKTLEEKTKYKKQVSVNHSKKAGTDELVKNSMNDMKNDFLEKNGK